MKLVLGLTLLMPAILWGSLLSNGSMPFGLLALVVFLAWTAYCLSDWFKKTSRGGPSIGNLIAGFCFVDLLAVSVATPITVAILLMVALLFISTLKFQKIISGT